jgi:hypothetical protein
MKFFFHPKAEDEFNHAIEYYESLQPGLGFDFSREVYLAIRRAIDYSEAWSIFDGRVRRSLVKRFPYGILY